MERGILEADPRHTMRRIKTAMQGNALRALVELITNADDSYIRLEYHGRPSTGVIEILYGKDGRRGVFGVRDYAEGMSVETVRSAFKKYGAATSGMKDGIRVRGYFGQGAKDALASMTDGRICTFKDGQYAQCRLFIEGRRPMYEIDDPRPATPELRVQHGIPADGTVAYFKAEPRVPRFQTVQEELANSYLLRKIMTNPRRRVFMLDQDTKKSRQLRYRLASGSEVLADVFHVLYPPLGEFPVTVLIYRAETGELRQTGDDREGGLLLVDDQDVVLGISLFKFDNEPLASRLFGEVRIEGFRRLLEEEEAVLSEERDGLVTRHPFCRNLIPEIEKRIEKVVKEERLRKQKEGKSKIDREETARYRKAFSVLNEIAEAEAQAVFNLGQKPTDQVDDPPNGFCIYPSSAQITVGKRYAFELRMNTAVVPLGSVVNISCSHPRIRVLTPEVRLGLEDQTGVLQKYMTVEGSEPNIKGILQAQAGQSASQAEVFVIPEKELLLSEGLAFQPESITVRPNQPRRIYLLVYVKMIEGGSIIKVSSDNESVRVSKSEIAVIESDAVRHVAKYELEVWGEGPGQKALVTAECESRMALLGVRVRAKEEDEKDKGRKGMFSEPDFNFDTNPIQRTSYSRETAKVIIYVNFPSVRHYLGDHCQYRKTLPSQILIADLVAERCFFEIAKAKVEASGTTLRPEGIRDRIERDAHELSRKYGKKLHEVLVDPKMLEQSRSEIDNDDDHSDR